MLIHPTVERLRSLGLAAMADTLDRDAKQSSGGRDAACRLARSPHRSGSYLSRQPPPFAPIGRRQAPSEPPPSRTSTIAPLGGSIELSSKRSPQANGSANTTIWPLSAQPAPENPGLPALSVTRPAVMASPSSTSELHVCSPISPKRVGKDALPRLMTMLERTNLIIIDDWGPEPLTAEQRRDLLEIVDDRYDKGSLLITSQVPVNTMARHYCRPDARRRHIGPHHSQCSSHRAQGRQSASRRRRKEKGLNSCLTKNRSTGPQDPPARGATPLVGATPRHARVPPMDRRNDLNRAASLDQETISRTTSNRQLCSPPRPCSAMSQSSR